MLKYKYHHLTSIDSERQAYHELVEHFKKSDLLENEIYETNCVIYKKDVKTGKYYTDSNFEELQTKLHYHTCKLLYEDINIINPILESYNLDLIIWDNYAESVNKTRFECKKQLNKLFYIIYPIYDINKWLHCDCSIFYEFFS